MKLFLIGLVVGFLLGSTAFTPARAHGDAAWVMADPATSWCCGPQDCSQLADDAVTITPAGILINETGELVLFSQAKRSIDDHWWRCRTWEGKTRCLFQPDMGY